MKEKKKLERKKNRWKKKKEQIAILFCCKYQLEKKKLLLFLEGCGSISVVFLFLPSLVMFQLASRNVDKVRNKNKVNFDAFFFFFCKIDTGRNDKNVLLKLFFLFWKKEKWYWHEQKKVTLILLFSFWYREAKFKRALRLHQSPSPTGRGGKSPLNEGAVRSEGARRALPIGKNRGKRPQSTKGR